MTDFAPSRQQSDLADVIEMLLDKGVVINADIAVSIGDTQLLGVQIRAAIASFETAAKYGLEFPEGTDMRRLAAAVDEPELVAREKRRNLAVDPTRGVNVSPDPDSADEEAESGTGGEGESGDEGGADGESESDDESGERGTDRLGARPDPEVPVEDGDVGSSLAAIGEDEDADGSEETEGEGDADESEGTALESEETSAGSEETVPESDDDEDPNDSAESDDETAEATAEENE